MPRMHSSLHLALRALGSLTAASLLAGAAVACPADTQPRAPGTLLTVKGDGVTAMALGAADLAALPAATLTQKLSVSAGAGAASERSITYSGTLLRDLLLKAGMGGPTDRSARWATVELVATDGYRSVFSWGELFNTAVGEQVLIITAQDGKPLDAAAGPLALRSLADLRPGPRHVRNLCAVSVRRAVGG